MLAQYAMFQKIVSVASQFVPRALAEMKPLGFKEKKKSLVVKVKSTTEDTIFLTVILIASVLNV